MSNDILQHIHIAAPAAALLRALSTLDGLSKWWTSTTTGDPSLGEVIHFRFGSHVTKARVTVLEEGRVRWDIESSNPDWEGTHVVFDFEKVEGDKTLLRFGHCDWKSANAFFGHCSMKWATFLLSLRAYLETGTGRPFPDDVAI